MLKRLFDILVSGTLLLVLSPVILLTAFAVRCAFGSPVLFCQRRPGLHGQLFTIYKFRTMLDTRDAQGELLPDDDRQTRFGRFLRSSSLDELPELWNVLCGDMSLVGPRPLLEEYLGHYTPDQFRRHDVRPGVTGWAQINGRADLEWEEKLAYDIWYVDHLSFWLDLKIIFATIGVVLGWRGTQTTHHGVPPTLQAPLISGSTVSSSTGDSA
jgi:lipopolysaccharide/colanic/teichoic acid biosynthesis glycosyltransferase